DLPAGHARYRHDARAHGVSIDVYGARPAQRRAAAELRSRHAQHIAQHPQKRRIGPDVYIDLIDRPTEKPWGVGEASAAVVPAAISNAVWDAVGVRLRSVPFTPQKVLAALKGA